MLDAVIVRGLPLPDHVNVEFLPWAIVRIDREGHLTYDEEEFNKLLGKHVVVPTQSFPRYEAALDFLPLLEDADRRYLTVLSVDPLNFGLVKYGGGGPCPDCRGSGEYRGLLVVERCDACNGSGRRFEETAADCMNAERMLQKALGLP